VDLAEPKHRFHPRIDKLPWNYKQAYIFRSKHMRVRSARVSDRRALIDVSWIVEERCRVEVVAVLIHPIIPLTAQMKKKKNKNLTTKPIKDPEGWTHSD
jgi:hypothetical protein